MKVTSVGLSSNYAMHDCGKIQSVNKEVKEIKNNVINVPNSYYVNFEGININNALATDSKLYNKFLKSNGKSILDFLNNEKTTPLATFKFLLHATSNNQTSVAVAEELSRDPRKGAKIKSFLLDRLGGGVLGKKLYDTWYHDEKNGYRAAYGNYYESEIWSKAKSLNDIVKQSPNVAPWAFTNKAEEIGIEPILGEVPKEFNSIEDYRGVINYLKEWNLDLSKKISEYEKEVQSTIKDTMKAAEMINTRKNELVNPFEIQVNKKIFEVTPIIKSFSAKVICLINEKGNKNRYALKFAPYDIKDNSDFGRKFAENQALRADMPYLDSLTDFYLRLNKSKNAPDIKLFDYKTQSVLYGMTNGEEAKVPEKYNNNLYLFSKYSKVADIKKLGININDAHGGNFIVDGKGNYIIIDSGHATYSSEFRPLIMGKQITLSNLCGRELCK